MYKICRCIATDNSAKKTRLLHGCNLALLTLLLSTTLLSGPTALQEPAEGPVRRIEVLSYEGEKVSSVEAEQTVTTVARGEDTVHRAG